MNKAAPRILYRFHLPTGIEEIALDFEPDDFLLRTRPDDPPPAWAALEFEKCGHCPLSSADSPNCPFAAALSGYVESFSHLESHREVKIEVITPMRTVSAVKPLQTGIASLVGLIGATSGCPHLAFYRPMARFHLPFADQDETVYRVLSMFVLRSYFAGKPPDLEQLNAAIASVSDVNAGMATRIRAGFAKDAMVNAIVILDFLAQTVPLAIDSRFDDLRQLFAPTASPPG